MWQNRRHPTASGGGGEGPCRIVDYAGAGGNRFGGGDEISCKGECLAGEEEPSAFFGHEQERGERGLRGKDEDP